MRIRPAYFLSAFALLSSAAQAQGQVFLEQLPNQFTFTFADTDCNVCGPGSDQSVAENFVVPSTSTLSQIVIWGVHDNGSASDPNSFDVYIYDDQAGAVGAFVYQEFGVPSVAVATGATVANEAEVECTLTPVSPPQLAAGTYWIEIHNNTSTTGASWGWVSAPLDTTNGIDGYSFSTTAPGGTWFPDNFASGGPNVNMAMRLLMDGLGTSYCPMTPNSVGPGAVMAATGSSSIAANNLVIGVTGATPNEPGVFYYGPNQIQVPFGEGNRCVGGTIVRLWPPSAADAGGNNSRVIDNSTAPNLGVVVDGASLNFQYWFRDPAGGPSGFNLSDGLDIAFTP